MDKSFHAGNRRRLYAEMKPASLLIMFSGEDIRKTNDEHWPFFTDRSFYYLTGLDSRDFALMAVKDGSGSVSERVYILPPDPLAERWTGRRIKPAEAEALSGIGDVRFVSQFEGDLHALLAGGHYSAGTSEFGHIYLDLFRVSPRDIDRPAHKLLKRIQSDYPFLQVENANAILRRLRLIKQPCEI
ncbi:MAG: aminopeptidase P N-terminal domain-containing protein, partial [Clostridia bacterium]|nr:aminopeptidase P N-terminal domain-containing protein [Clostridia bacterium]